MSIPAHKDSLTRRLVSKVISRAIKQKNRHDLAKFTRQASPGRIRTRDLLESKRAASVNGKFLELASKHHCISKNEILSLNSQLEVYFGYSEFNFRAREKL
jgi:ethanolamine utilization protein EutQ (cupin superfamily)